MILVKRIKSLLKTKDAKTLSTNFASLALLKVAGYIFPLITLPYLARVIGVDKFGELAFATAIIVYFETLVDFGFNYTATRDVAKNRDSIDYISKAYSTVLVSRLLLMLLSIFILNMCIYTIPFFYEKRLILWLTFLYIPGNILFPEWFFQAVEQMRYITIINLGSKLLFTFLVFIIIKDKSDYIYQPVLTALGFFVSGIFATVIIKRKFNIKFICPKFNDISTAFKSSWNMFISLFFPNLYTNFSIILLRNYGGAIETGIYSSGYRFVGLLDQITQVLSRTFYPFLARRIDKHGFYVKISSFISLVAGLLLFFGADLFVKMFYTSDFNDAVIIIRIMSICPFFLFLMNTYGTNYLVLVGKENILRNIIMICSIGGFILTWFIVVKYNSVGVAITITIVWGIRGFLTWFYAVRHRKLIRNNC